MNDHPDLKNRVIVSGDDNKSIEDNVQKLVAIDVNEDTSSDFTTPLIVGLIIGLLVGLIGAVFIMKWKSN